MTDVYNTQRRARNKVEKRSKNKKMAGEKKGDVSEEVKVKGERK